MTWLFFLTQCRIFSVEAKFSSIQCRLFLGSRRLFPQIFLGCYCPGDNFSVANRNYFLRQRLLFQVLRLLFCISYQQELLWTYWAKGSASIFAYIWLAKQTVAPLYLSHIHRWYCETASHDFDEQTYCSLSTHSITYSIQNWLDLLSRANSSVLESDLTGLDVAEQGPATKLNLISIVDRYRVVAVYSFLKNDQE